MMVGYTPKASHVALFGPSYYNYQVEDLEKLYWTH